jgi:hypothetical protein
MYEYIILLYTILFYYVSENFITLKRFLIFVFLEAFLSVVTSLKLAQVKVDRWLC